jgi:hypothetical protein
MNILTRQEDSMLRNKLSVVLLLLVLLAGLPFPTAAKELAIGPIAGVIVKVVDDFGKPVEGVSVNMAVFDHWKPGEGFGEDIFKNTRAITDQHGMAVLQSVSARPSISCNVPRTPGYYTTASVHYNFLKQVEGHWEPRKPTLEIVLKPVLNPTAMYARKVRGLGGLPVPEMNKKIGFDLMVGDWVAPYGKGVIADFIFQAEKQYQGSPNKPFEAKFALTFSNEDDGIQSVIASPREGSELRLPRYAPESGYEAKLIRRKYKEEGKPIEGGRKEDQNYFFRVRTIKQNGKIVSALYGKIYGDISIDVFGLPNAKLYFQYYLNPEPNSRNMEFDKSKNLFKGLSQFEQVNDP